MIVANRAMLSGIIRTPFLSPAGQGFSGGIHNNIRLDLSPTPLGFGRMRYRTAHTRFVQDKMTASSAFPLIATEERPSRDVSNVPQADPRFPIWVMGGRLNLR